MNLRLFKNVLYNWAGMLGSMVYAFFMVPYIIQHLGDTNYGLWNLVASIVGYIYILDFGIQSSVNRYISKYHAVDDKEHVNSVYANAMAVYGIIALGAICAGVWVAIYFSKIFHVPQESIGTITHIALVMVVYSALELPLSVYGSILYAYQRFDAINIISLAALALQSLLLVGAFKYRGGLTIFCYVMILVGLTKYSVNFLFSHRVVGHLKFRFSALSKEMLAQMLKFSGITFAAIISSNVIFKTDNIVIGMYLDPKAITIYSIGFMLTEYGAQIIGKMCTTFTPKFSEHHSRGEQEELDSLLISSTRFSTLIGIPMGLAVLVVGKDFIQLWLGTGYQDAFTVTAIMMCARMCGFPTAPLYSLLYGVGSHHLILYTGVAEAILNLGLSLYLVQKIGITGVAWGTFIPMLLGNVVFVLFTFKKLRLSILHWLKAAIVGPISFSVAFVIAIYYLCHLFPSPTWSTLIAKVLLILIIYATFFLAFGLNKIERTQLRHAFLHKLLEPRNTKQPT